MKKFTAQLVKVLALNQDTFQFDFEFLEEPVDFKAGQFFMIEVPDGEKKITRAYSVSSSPDFKKGFSFCVKILPDGKASQYLKSLEIGQTASFMGSFGHFVLADSPKDIVMVATGTGLAPFMSMLPTLFAQGWTWPITLYFGVRHEEDLFYIDELRKWEKEHHNFKALVTLSQPSEAWTGEKGRVTEHLAELNIENVQVYICGNGDMVKSVKEMMDSKGLQKTDLHLEQFTPLK
jgi:ferredoxin-NADP reductase